MSAVEKAIGVLLLLRAFHSPEECWIWPRVGKKGYGEFGRNGGGEGKWGRAHRLSFEYFIGSASDLFVCHRCDNPSCVNPNHLFLGTADDNNQDKIKKGRQNLSGLRGTRKSRPYFTEPIKQRLMEAAKNLPKRRAGRTEYAAEIADELGINLIYTMRILNTLHNNGKVWA